MTRIVFIDTAAMLLGAADGVIRASEIEDLNGIAEAHNRMREMERISRERAETEATAILEAARQDAARVKANAETDIRARLEAGYEEGLQRVAAEWHARQVEHTERVARAMESAQPELVEVIMACVSRLVLNADRATFFGQALTAIQGYVRDQTSLRLRVHPDDAGGAQAAIATWLQSARTAVAIEVQADARLEPGSGIFESPAGVFDASLSVQLSALREAMGVTLTGGSHASTRVDVPMGEPLPDESDADGAAFDAEGVIDDEPA